LWLAGSVKNCDILLLQNSIILIITENMSMTIDRMAASNPAGRRGKSSRFC